MFSVLLDDISLRVFAPARPVLCLLLLQVRITRSPVFFCCSSCCCASTGPRKADFERAPPKFLLARRVGTGNDLVGAVYVAERADRIEKRLNIYFKVAGLVFTCM